MQHLPLHSSRRHTIGGLQVSTRGNIEQFKVHLTRKRAELVFNLGELGSAGWREWKIKKMIASAAVPKEDAYHSVSHSPPHLTFLACVSATGVAVSDEMKILWSANRAKLMSTRNCFFEQISNVVILYVDAVRGCSGLETGTAILLMNSAFPHTYHCILQNLNENNIIVISCPAHTTNLFQALDLVFFGALRKLKVIVVDEFDDDSVNAQITELVQADE
jgi:hypothetical protein